MTRPCIVFQLYHTVFEMKTNGNLIKLNPYIVSNMFVTTRFLLENPTGDDGGVAAGDEAQSVFELTRTRNSFIDELLEVCDLCLYFLIFVRVVYDG